MHINWGMIGCGDVTEKKSAPSFNKIHHSRLLGVCSRTRDKAVSYAERHGVPKVYDSAEQLLTDPEINALYIATPPFSHPEYAIQAMMAGKPVYVEKPMATNYEECMKMNEVSEKTGVPIFVAYYRRSMDYFLKVRELLEGNAIGKPYLCQSRLFVPPRAEDYEKDNLPWRVVPEISGGGYFHDMGCHELDILLFLFGEVRSVRGSAGNFGQLYRPEDTVIASMVFENGLLYNGSWCFAASKGSECDEIEVIGESGSLTFSCFGFTPIDVKNPDSKQEFPVAPPENVQYPMIKAVVEELQGKGRSPSRGDTGARVNWLMDRILGKI
ncbi:MAG: Gfo/Idh/MocA family oxidoreductase [Bacteroidales bacterium]|nr:Gfo/Idh/MocA family oxidoreductase [Bacteroidales bacterium]